MRELRRRSVFLLVALGASAGLRAADAPMEALSFDEAVRRAVENNHDVARAATAILSAEALLGKARAETLPAIETYASWRALDDERGFSGIVAQPRDQLAVGATVSVRVLAAAQWAAKAQAADQVGVARLEEAEIRRQISVATAQAYLAVIGTRRQVEVDERARDNAQAQYDHARTRFEGGAGSRLDAMRAADVLATDEVLVERSRYALTLAREALGVLLAADGPVDAAGEPVLDVPPEDEALDLSQRADLRLLAAERAAAERVLRDSWKDWVPEVVASFDPLYVDPAGTFEESKTWRAVLAARFPIYLGGDRRSDRELRGADLEAAGIDLDQAELRARAEVRSAREAIAAAERGLAQARVAAGHAAEVLAITDIAFRAGARTNIELVDAQRRARDAETAAARAEDLLRLAKLTLLDALGRFGG
jgi:outer membrane protein TolC